MNFFNILWKETVELGVGKVTVLTHSLKEFIGTGSIKPVERSYVVFLYFPAAKMKASGAIKENVIINKMQGILKPESTVMSEQRNTGDKSHGRSKEILVQAQSRLLWELPEVTQALAANLDFTPTNDMHERRHSTATTRIATPEKRRKGHKHHHAKAKSKQKRVRKSNRVADLSANV